MELRTRDLRQLPKGKLSERSEFFPLGNVLSEFLVVSDIGVLSLKEMADGGGSKGWNCSQFVHSCVYRGLLGHNGPGK